MIVYHGSNSRFKTLRIEKRLVKNTATMNNEGMGIYFSTDPNVASSYGKYMYVLEVNDKYFLDCRKLANCKKLVNAIAAQLWKEHKFNLGSYVSLNDVANNLYYGIVGISGVCLEIELLLDSTEQWWCKVDEKTRNKVLKALNRISKNPPKVYMFNYNIPNIGIIKDVSPDVVRILEVKNTGTK